MNRWTDRQTAEEWTDRQTDRHLDQRKDDQTEVWMDRKTYGWTYGQTDRQIG